jgi:hypothetical protein
MDGWRLAGMCNAPSTGQTRLGKNMQISISQCDARAPAQVRCYMLA